MKIFRQLRWKMTFSYTLVTVGALLVITLILGGIAFTKVFIPVQSMDPEQLIDAWINSRISSSYPTLCQLLSQSPVDIELLNVYLKDPQSNINESTEKGFLPRRTQRTLRFFNEGFYLCVLRVLSG